VQGVYSTTQASSLHLPTILTQVSTSGFFVLHFNLRSNGMHNVCIASITYDSAGPNSALASSAQRDWEKLPHPAAGSRYPRTYALITLGGCSVPFFIDVVNTPSGQFNTVEDAVEDWVQFLNKISECIPNSLL
jgi:hypothetical protein